MRALLPFLLITVGCIAEIPNPTDAPKPLPPGEAARSFHLPAGYEMKLIASEPLIHEPSGVCWDERGRMIVTELHGYNVEGQYDIDDLNKSGELDLQVRRVQANDAAKERAKPDNYGTVKLLIDNDGDGVMDNAIVWADKLPLCYGAAPARGGVIIACAPDILYLADKDGDGRAETREVLFTGFGVGQPERGVNCPTWGVDNWLYFGRGHSGGTITGPHLKKPVVIGNTDFRIRVDGSAIEPITGSTKTIGMTFTEGGDRFVTNTTSPGLFVTPIPAHYLTRNPDAPAPVGDEPAADYNTVFPLAPAHPWRVKREQHADYFAFYKKISLSDAAASGYFTSACGPLVYQDTLMPELHGQYLVCEPAQNLVHRARIERDGTRLRLKRLPEESRSEFLASTDSWFHPINLHHTPDGSIAIVDFYREIIEDYSAIPRHLQQQYGVINGHDRGRIWVLTKADHKPVLNTSMSSLDDMALVRELNSELYWRRLTARRLLIERKAAQQSETLVRMLDDRKHRPSTVLSTLYALEGMGKLNNDVLAPMLKSTTPSVQIHALRCAEPFFVRHAASTTTHNRMVELDLGCLNYTAPEAGLQAALTLGESERGKQGAKMLAEYANRFGNVRWMDSAVLSSAHGNEVDLLKRLTQWSDDGASVARMAAGVIAGRGDAKEIESTIQVIHQNAHLHGTLNILKLGLEDTKPLANKIEVPAPTAPTKDQLAALEKRLPEFTAALQQKPNLDEGRTLFTAVCSVCHKSQGIGFSVGPDLDAEFQRAPEIILRDILFPHEAQRPGFETVMAKTQRGETLIGIAASDSTTSLTLRMQGGIERTILRKRASVSTVRNVSLMPAGLGEALKPAQVASIIAFLRQPRAPK